MPNFKAGQTATRKDTRDRVIIVRELTECYLVEHLTDGHTAILDDSQLFPPLDRSVKAKQLRQRRDDVAALVLGVQARVAAGNTLDVLDWSDIYTQLTTAARHAKAICFELEE